MMRKWLVFLIVPLFTISVYCQNIDSLDAYISKAVTDWKVPGLAVAVVKDGKVLLSKGYGVKEMGKNDKVDQHTLFAIASNTKAFITTSLGMLVDQKRISWDDPVKKYLSYFQLYDDYTSQHTTVKDLLCHRVGLGTFSGDVVWYKSEYSAEEVVKRISQLPQVYPFRGGFGYTNVMFLAAGEVIQKVSGKTWFEFVKENITSKIGMNRTISSTKTLSDLGNAATPHKSIYGEVSSIAWTNWDNMGAAGGIISSVNDMAKWMMLNLNGGTNGSQQIIPTTVYDDLWTLQNSNKIRQRDRERNPSTNFNGYGLGWNLQDLGGNLVVSHGGGYDGMFSQVMMVPGQKLGIVILTNSMTGISSVLSRFIVERFLKLPYQDRAKTGLSNETDGQKSRKKIIDDKKNTQVKDTKPTGVVSQMAGKYFDPMYGELLIKAKNDQEMELIFPNAPALNATLRHFHYDTYEIVWNEVHAWYDFGTLQFVYDNEHKKVVNLIFDVPNEDIFFEEIKPKRVD